MDARGDISRLTAVVKPDIGVITNVGVSHLERLGTRENILAAKLEIAEGMADGSPLILCGDNDLLSTVEIPRLRVLRYGIEAPELDARAEEIVTGEGETRFVIVWKGRTLSCPDSCHGPAQCHECPGWVPGGNRSRHDSRGGR